MSINVDQNFRPTFRAQLAEDKKLAFLAIGLIFVYNIFFLGTCSPIHCRLILAIAGIACIAISITVGYHIGFEAGYEQNESHEALPILMLGIGVDDMFVICNALDQSSLKKKPVDRLTECMKHAGPSITITSITDTLAFLSGTGSKIPGI